MPQTIKLTKSLLGGKVTEFTFREPRLEDFMLLGEPTAPMSLGNDKYLPVPIPSLVKSYMERLLIDGDVTVLDAACLRDAMEIQKVILGFFEDAEGAMKSDASSANSSSSQGSETLAA